MDHRMYAANLFEQGYNCAQAVAVAFSDLTGLDEKASARIISAFGGGMGRMREVCGAVSGMLMVTSILYGYDDAQDTEGKKALYQLVQDLATQFREKGTGSIICRDILNDPSSDPTPSERTEEYYRLRPCARMVYNAAEILDDYIARHPVSK